MERVGARVFGPTLLGKLVTDTFPALIYRSNIDIFISRSAAEMIIYLFFLFNVYLFKI